LILKPELILLVQEYPTEKHNMKKGTKSKKTGTQTVEEIEVIKKFSGGIF
jgi:hypothetical protein